MKETKNVNIGGYAFHIEEDAFESLNGYLDKLEKGYEKDPNRKEIMADIENRLGEILSEQKGNSEVIDIRMVSYAMTRIGNPEDLEEEDEIRSKAPSNKKRRIYRDIDRNTFGGVCTGLAHYFNTDPTWIRVIFTVLFVGGMFCWDGKISLLTMLAYFILWLCIPAAKTVEQKCEMLGQPLKLTEYKDYEPARPVREGGSFAGRLVSTIAGIILLITGGSMLAGSVAIPFGNHFAGTMEVRTAIYSDSDIPTEVATILFHDIICNQIFWWFVFATAFFFSLLMVYEGIVLCFKFKRPSWHPGLVLLMLWIFSIMALAIYTIYQFNAIMNFS